MPGTALLQSPGIGKSVRSQQLPLLRTLLASLTSRALPSALKIPLCDTSEANGSIEVLPCTQFLADPGLADSCKIVLLSRFAVRLANPKGTTISDDDLLRRGDFRSRRLNMRRGDCWLQDLRTLHRGTSSTSEEPRPELCLNYTRDFWAIPANEIAGVGVPGDANYRPGTISRADFDALQLTPRGWALLGHAAPAGPRL